LRRAIAAAATFACLTVGVGMAAAGDSYTTPMDEASGGSLAARGGGGVNMPDPPHLRDVVCVNTCASMHKATSGSRVEARGRHLGKVKQVLFDQRGGGRVSVQPIATSGRSVKARVPATAADGKPKVVTRSGDGDTSPKALRIVSADQIGNDGGFRLRHAHADPGKAFYAGTKPARVEFKFAGSGSTNVKIQVVHRENGRVVDQWRRDGLQPNTSYTAHWDGRSRSPNGGYRFKIGPASTGKMGSRDGARFAYYKFRFPVRGRHQYWDGFGAPRSGHTHQGQDVGANCGTPLVAVRAGRIQVKSYQAGGAGYYVVLDGKNDNHDYVYMHLRRPASVHEGEHVKTGERIGVVGSTGDASGCHLHFEAWKGEWWGGGRPLPSVTKMLKRWDSWS
jgi:murein DD-endopeptidase MepM/ murein hydrolase activator NlpD